MRTSFCIIVGFFLMFIMTSPIQAQYERIAGFHEHDGFFLRFQAGYGSGKMVEKDLPEGNLNLSGSTGTFRFQIGGAIAENLVLFGEYGGFFLSDADVDWGSFSDYVIGMDVTITDFGGGLTYYFMPANFYLSGTFTISRDKFERKESNVPATSASGFGMYVSAGKEWWVAADWGLGAAGFYYFSHTTDKGTDANTAYPISNSVIGIVFSATYH